MIDVTNAMYFTVDIIDVGVTEVKMTSYDSFAACHFRLNANCITVTMRLTGAENRGHVFMVG
jgi:hypothetical protein